MKQLTLQLPLSPSINHYWKHTVYANKVHTYISKEGVAFRQEVQKIYCNYLLMLRINGSREYPFIFFPEERLEVNIEIYPHRLGFDIDNRIKAAQDAMQYAGVYKDDRQIDKLVVERKEKTKDGKMIATIKSL
jgi:Holliday junction resolvase RusA-like endonuclease